MSERYVLNVNPGGTDVLHVNPREECNTDDADHLETVDGLTAASLLDKGEAVRCQHCTREPAT